MADQQHVVMVNGTVFGPFDYHADAVRFADYLTHEGFNPAEVLPLCSPVRDLLNWRDARRAFPEVTGDG